MVAPTHHNVTLYVHCLSCLCFAVEILTYGLLTKGISANLSLIDTQLM